MTVQRLLIFTAGALRLCFLAAALASPAVVDAQAFTRAQVQQRSQQVSQFFNWYYAAAFGTGVYTIGEETVSVIRLPMAYNVRQATDTEWGLRFTFPVSAAFAEFDLTDFDLGHASAVGLSVLPGVEAEIPLRPGWVVKPFANVGTGWEFEHDTSAMIWSLGVSTLYRLDLDRKWPLGFGAKLIYAGYDAASTTSTLAAVSLGVDLGFPIEFEVAGRPAFLGAQIVGTKYFNNLEFLFPGSPTDDVSNEVEIALTLRARKPYQILGVSFDRIGLGYRQGSDGLKGVRLVASFPF
jgi:hypothetical protein